MSNIDTTVRHVRQTDRAAWLAMRLALWPDATADEHAHEVDQFFAGGSRDPEAVIVAERSGEIVGFAEFNVRSHASGCTTHDVAYLEGWFVAESARLSGVGRALVEAGEAWGRERGCREMGSDTWTWNEPSIAAHRGLGFEEVVRVVCFAKKI